MFTKLFMGWHQRDIRRRIRRHGWTAIFVGDYVTGPTWAYSIGFMRSVGAPEVILFDMPLSTANDLFHAIYRELQSGDLVIRDSERWGPADESSAVWRKVHPSRFVDDPEHPWMALAFDFHLADGEGEPFEGYQLVFGDADGHLPWEPGYDERLRPLQRALWEPAELAPAASV